MSSLRDLISLDAKFYNPAIPSGLIILILVIHNDRWRGSQGICPDASFLHHGGDFIRRGQGFQLLRLDEFQNQFMVGSFYLEAFLNMVQEIFGTFIRYLKLGCDLLVRFELVHQVAYTKPSKHLFASVDATSMRYSADAHSSVASW